MVGCLTVKLSIQRHRCRIKFSSVIVPMERNRELNGSMFQTFRYRVAPVRMIVVDWNSTPAQRRFVCSEFCGRWHQQPSSAKHRIIFYLSLQLTPLSLSLGYSCVRCVLSLSLTHTLFPARIYKKNMPLSPFTVSCVTNFTEFTDEYISMTEALLNKNLDSLEMSLNLN